jgi:hypothetical protein
MKHAGVVARPMSKTEHPALASPANSAAPSLGPDSRGSRPTDTRSSSPSRAPSSSRSHSPKLSAITSTASGERSTARPGSPSSATPRTSGPFCSLRTMSPSSPAAETTPTVGAETRPPLAAVAFVVVNAWP